MTNKNTKLQPSSLWNWIRSTLAQQNDVFFSVITKCIWGWWRFFSDTHKHSKIVKKKKKIGPNTNFSHRFQLISCHCVGYRIRLGSSTDKKDTGRLHVDFAQARDDLYEWECRQRMLAREERHRRKMEEDRLRPPSPPPIVHYSEHECSQLGEKIKGWQTFHSYIIYQHTTTIKVTIDSSIKPVCSIF